MKWILYLTLLTSVMNEKVLVDISSETSHKNWQIVNDGVMGGVSTSSFTINNEEYGTFEGEVSLDNYGGFASLRKVLDTQDISAYTQIVLYVRGDMKRYQFRIKATQNEPFAYVHAFDTNGEWQKIILDLDQFYPSYRGRTLDLPNYNPTTLTEIRFLIGNKKYEKFRLDIKKITLL